MGKILVEIMPKVEILDPQGKAIVNALHRMDMSEFTGARQGKRFELEVEGIVNDEHLKIARKAAEEFLSNPIIEDVVNVSEFKEKS